MGSAQIQSQLWGNKAQDWADFQEGMSRPIYQEVIRQTELGPGKALLDVGCGSGMFCEIASMVDSRISGIDATPEMLAIARQRLPKGDFRLGEMEELPYKDHTFDITTNFNAIQYAHNPEEVLRELRRVTKPGGLVSIVTWGDPQRCDIAKYFWEMRMLAEESNNPFALSDKENLIEMLQEAGLHLQHDDEITVTWFYPDQETLLRGLLSTGSSINAIQNVGEERVRTILRETLFPFTLPSGGYRLENAYMYLIAMA